MDSNSLAAPGGGGGRRNRGRGKRNSKRNNNNSGSGKGGGAGGSSGSGNTGPKKTAVPPPPQVKLAFRHIGNPTVYGTTKAVLENLLLPLLDVCNAKTTAGVPSGPTLTATSSVTPNTGFFFEIDAPAKRHLIDEEEAALKYRKDWEEKQKGKPSTQESKEEDDAQTPPEENKVEVPQTETIEPVKETETLDVIAAPAAKAPPNFPVVMVRPLYVVPPRKTRRLGDRPGVAYILLTAPRIEKVEIPETVPEDGIPAIVAQGAEVESILPEGTAPKSEGGTKQDHAEGNAELANTPDLVSETPTHAAPSTSTPPASVSSASAKKSIDYSRQVAQGRMLLQNAIDVLTQMASSSSTAQENGKGQHQAEGTGISIQVETALSGKTWRWQYTRPDRRESTIETTADYKNWVTSVEQQQADLKARPKPAPGGGAATVSSEDGVAGAGGIASGQPIAALVQHLRAKQQELKRKKAKKKRETGAAGGPTKDGNRAKQGGGKGGKNPKKGKPSAKGEAASKGNADAGPSTKKKAKTPRTKKTGSNNPKAVAPTVVLKASGTTCS